MRGVVVAVNNLEPERTANVMVRDGAVYRVPFDDPRIVCGVVVEFDPTHEATVPIMVGIGPEN